MAKMLVKLAVVSVSMASVGAMELTPENWDEQTAGKTVFIKFLAPW